MLSSNTNSLTWVAIATGLALVVGGGALTLYPDAFNSVSKMVQNKAIPTATESKDSTSTSNLSDILSDGAKSVVINDYLYSPIAIDATMGYTTIAASNYSSSQKATLARAVSGDSVDATTGFIANPDSAGIAWVLDGAQPLTNAKWSDSTNSRVLDTSKINDSHYYNVGVSVSYNDTNSKQSDGSYLCHTRIVNIKATGAQLKSWSALSIKENDGVDYSGVTNAIWNQEEDSSETLEVFLSSLGASADTSTWTSGDKSSMASAMTRNAGVSPDILSKVLPQIMDSSH